MAGQTGCQRRYDLFVHSSVRAFVCSSVIKLVNTILWKRMNQFWYKLAKVVHGTWAWNSQLLEFRRSSKAKVTKCWNRYCTTNYNEISQVHITANAHCVTVSRMEKVMRGWRQIWRSAGGIVLDPFGSSSFSSSILTCHWAETNSLKYMSDKASRRFIDSIQVTLLSMLLLYCWPVTQSFGGDWELGLLVENCPVL